jgi:hypothetical protein
MALSLEELKTKKRNNILNLIESSYEQYINSHNINNGYKNFFVNKEINLIEFSAFIFKSREIQDLKVNHKDMYNDFKTVLKSIFEESSKKIISNPDNLILMIKNNLKLEITTKEKLNQNDLINLDLNKMLKKYFGNKYDLNKVDKFIEMLSRSVSINNYNYQEIQTAIVKQIIKINFPYTMDKNNEIKTLATDLEEHLNKKGKIPPPGLDNNPTDPDLS